MEGGGIFAWTRGRRAYIDYIKAHAKIPWMSFTTKNKAYVKLVRSSIPPYTLNAWGSVFAKGKSNSEKIDKQRNNFLVFKLEQFLKKAREKRRPASTYGICGHFFWSNGQSRITYYACCYACPWIISSGSGDENERAQNKKTKRKQYIHQRFQASFLSSVRNKSWMRLAEATWWEAGF